jgi:asparagine synthase (glutamine-hydrolysing)
MSGICGILLKHESAPNGDGEHFLRTYLPKLSRGISSRGLDGNQTHLEAQFGGALYVNRENRDENRNESMRSNCGRYVIVFDGRIDNREFLSRQLPHEHAPSADASDSAYALAAFVAWGDSSPQQLQGDFAYAIWDRTEKRLFCARDPLCGRPFYYVVKADFFAFASDERALIGLPGVNFEPNPEQFLSTYGGGLDYEHDEFLPWCRGIEALHGGYTLSVLVRAGSFEPRETRYWSEPSHNIPVARSMDEAVEQMECALVEAVTARTRGIDTAAMLMSGGLDSASVLMAVRLSRATDPRTRTYSIVADDRSACVESMAISDMQRLHGVEPYTITVPSFFSTVQAVDDFLTFAIANVHPIESSLQYQLPLLAESKRTGVRALLTGVGGDVVTNVPDVYPALAIKKGRFPTAIRYAREASKNFVYLHQDAAAAIFAKACAVGIPAALPKFVKSSLRPLRQQFRTSFTSARANKRASHDALIEHLGLPKDYVPTRQRACTEYFDRILDTTRAMNWVSHGQAGYDRSFGHFGVANADVWADQRVIQTYLNLPLEFRVQGGWTKSPIRHWLNNKGLSAVAWRKDKAHVGHYFNRFSLPELDTRKIEVCGVQGESTLSVAIEAICAASPRTPRHDVETAVRYTWSREP